MIADCVAHQQGRSPYGEELLAVQASGGDTPPASTIVLQKSDNGIEGAIPILWEPGVLI